MSNTLHYINPAPPPSPPLSARSRLKAGILADQCLARAPTFLQANPGQSLETTDDSRASRERDGTAHGPGDGLRPDPGVFEEARAAAREAQDKYSRAGNAEGALVARRTELALEADEVMADVAPLLSRG